MLLHKTCEQHAHIPQTATGLANTAVQSNSRALTPPVCLLRTQRSCATASLRARRSWTYSSVRQLTHLRNAVFSAGIWLNAVECLPLRNLQGKWQALSAGDRSIASRGRRLPCMTLYRPICSRVHGQHGQRLQVPTAVAHQQWHHPRQPHIPCESCACEAAVRCFVFSSLPIPILIPPHGIHFHQAATNRPRLARRACENTAPCGPGCITEHRHCGPIGGANTKITATFPLPPQLLEL